MAWHPPIISASPAHTTLTIAPSLESILIKSYHQVKGFNGQQTSNDWYHPYFCNNAIKHGPLAMALVNSVELDNPMYVHQLLDMGASSTVGLCAAVTMGRLQLAEIFLQRGANANAEGLVRDACQLKHGASMIQLLQRYGCHVWDGSNAYWYNRTFKPAPSHAALMI